jgi:ferredoxin/flavodoxin---NADP+ reductase
MATIIEKKLLRAPDVFYYKLAAPLIAKKAQPGQFVIVRIHDRGERIPLSLADIDPVAGTISLIVMAVGKTTSEMAALKPGESILDLCGPLGNPSEIEHVKKVVLVGGGFGTAPLYPIARAFKTAGSEVVTIMGARSKDLLIYENEMSQVCDRVLVATDDGSKGTKGLVTTVLKNEIDRQGVELVIAIGPLVMMRAVAETTRPIGIKTMVSLNPIMVDGTGMCGGCRVTVGGETRFACTDGPEFDGHQVEWDVLTNRQRKYHPEQKASFEQWKQKHSGLLCE